MNIKENILWAQHQLAHFYSPSLEAEVLLAAMLKKDRSWLKTNPGKCLSFLQQWKYKQWVRARKKNKPGAYIVGSKDFYGSRFFLNQHTLIPRDETEILCDFILHQERSFSPVSLLDVGTGSGVIALTMARCLSLQKVVAIDISRKALKIARKNFKKQGRKGFLLHSDMLQKIEPEASFDLIVANLPYVPQDMVLAPDLAYEPPSALFSGNDGLDHIRRLKQEIQQKNISFRELWLEFLPQQQLQVEQIFSSIGKVEFKKDLSGKVFFACIKKG